MSRAVFVSCVILALVAGACGGNSGAAAPPASGAQAAQAAAATPATPAAAPPGSPAAATASTPPASAPAPATTAAPVAVDPVKTTAQAADSLAGAAGAAPASAPAPAAATTPAQAPAPAAATAGAPPAAPAPAAPATAAESPEAARRKAEIDWAMKQDEIKNDSSGQWAVSAKASTSYNDAQGTAAFSAAQVTGVPNVESLGNNVTAWSPKTADGGIEWLEVSYAKPVFATAVRIRESLGPGAVIKVELFDDKGAPHAVWSGADATKGLNYLIVEFPRTAYKTDRVRMTFATNIVPGWQQIDAVQLVGTDRPVTTTAAAR